ncbi:MAG: rhomboid family intramembrane serine protease, partial [Desertifilum sp. SIO1I2]|nr:rhomboid family intramembrane serine protease [Desertifilum sp. SIO1I2]
MDRQDETNAIAKELKSQALILGTLVAIFWIVEIVDVVVFQGRLDTFGILPRHPIGLRGILLAPFLHGSFNHLIANTLPFLTLGWLVMLKETRDFFIVSAITLLISGLGVWLFGSPGFHIGASGVIFGYLGFLLLRGYFERSYVKPIYLEPLYQRRLAFGDKGFPFNANPRQG